MKKFIYLLPVLALFFTACDPMEDINAVLDAQEQVISGEATLTLSDDDYDALNLNYGNFSSIEDAKTMIPGLLLDRYPIWGEGSLVNVNFNLYDPIRVEDYTVTSSDYNALLDMGDIQGAHLSNNYDINDFFTYKFPQADKGSYVRLTYNKLSEQILYTLTDDDYALVGNGNYDNFDIRTGKNEEDIEVRREKIETILLNNFPDTPVNQQYLVSYAAFNNSYNTVILEMLLEFDGTNYNMVTGIEYTLTDADFELIGTHFSDTYPDPAYSAGRYHNFDRRSDRDSYWSNEMIAEALDLILKNLDPAAPEGTKYSVDMAIYDGSSGTLNMLVQLDGGFYGKLPETLIEETTLFALTDKWDVPFTLNDEDYTEMGQNYPNFSDEDLAWYRIAIFLKSQFPYAEVNDMIAVSYDLYNGGINTKYVNFIFDGTIFNAIPDVVEETIKFGHDGTTWVPDNTIKYTLTSADYALVGNDRYNNFDVREGRDEETVEARLAKINTILLNNFPGMAEGQKFAVSYNVYTGAAEVWEMKVILSGGQYVLQ
ncbi:hypothetical protein [Lutibacter sp.]|uniref:hypothetical protein n=1 Tax=Lutibacter sp. TaxID=1925666 RepID=UPI0025BD7BB0|nr:hypothetical protein [Lutibacter sp.]MCF6166920.1 hypothetical protein [Lutibacter sp.]